jgi:cytidine deaminase
MNKELIMKLIDRAREAGDNAYCPFTNVPVGCALLTEDNMIFCGCNIESKTFSSSASAGEVAVMKAISEGHTAFSAVCFYGIGFMPFPDGKTRQLLAEFNPLLNIVIANADTYSLSNLNEILPFVPELPETE